VAVADEDSIAAGHMKTHSIRNAIEL
jgi:hypothetical protein